MILMSLMLFNCAPEETKVKPKPACFGINLMASSGSYLYTLYSYEDRTPKNPDQCSSIDYLDDKKAD